MYTTEQFKSYKLKVHLENFLTTRILNNAQYKNVSNVLLIELKMYTLFTGELVAVLKVFFSYTKYRSDLINGATAKYYYNFKV